MSLYLDTVKMQYTKDPKPQTYYQLSGDYEKTEFVLPDNQDNLPSTPNDILALALRQSQYATDIQDLQNNNFDYEVLKELFDYSSDGIIVDGTLISSGDAKDIQELNNDFQAIDMTIKADGNVDVNKYKSIQDNVFHVLFETPGFFDLDRTQIDEIIEIATDELEDGRSQFTVEAIDVAKEQVNIFEDLVSKDYDVEITRTYIKTATVTVNAINESAAQSKAFEVIDDALASTSLTLIDDDEVDIQATFEPSTKKSI